MAYQKLKKKETAFWTTMKMIRGVKLQQADLHHFGMFINQNMI